MKIICIGMNYRDDLPGSGSAVPLNPVVFLKPDSSILKNNKPFFLPDFSENIQYGVHIVLKISKLGKGISAKFAPRYFDELTLGIDITARDIQNRLAAEGLPWDLSTAFDGSASLGSFLPVHETGDLSKTGFRLEINGKVVQKANTSDMIFSFNRIIEYVSAFFTLKTGDLIFTGNPSGTGTLKRNDNLVAYLDDKPILDFLIK